MRVLAFEDGYDIEALLISGSVNMDDIEFIQHWTTHDFLEKIDEFKPDILLLDHFIPPTRGGQVLHFLNRAVSEGKITRPKTIVAMSSASLANQNMLKNGADFGIVKFDLSTLEIWPKIGE